MIATSYLDTQAKEDQWHETKEKLLSDTILRESCDTFLITTNNTVSDAIRRQEAPVEVIRGP